MSRRRPGGEAPNRRLWPWLLALAVISLLFFLVPRPGATSSVLSKAPDGLWAMRAYLEARGVELELLDAPLETAAEAAAGDGADAEPGVLLLALPWQRFPGRDFEPALHHHLRSGGDLILAYEGRETPARDRIFETLGLTPVVELRGEPPLTPLGWWRYQKERVPLEPADAGAVLEIPALDGLPALPAAARVLYTAAGSPAVFEFDLHRGRVLVLPVALFSNAELAEAGHADLLEGLLRRLDGPWRIDEYHHGLIRPELVERGAASYAWDLFVLHLALLYGLALFAVGRRFGPAWVEERQHTGSTSDFLRSLGVLHHQLGHHRDAARRLLERARRLEPGLELPRAPSPELDCEKVEDGAGLVDFAAALSRHRQARHRQ